MKIILIFTFLLLLGTGCGTINLGTETHTHIKRGEIVSTDSHETARMLHIIRTLRKMNEPNHEPLENFEWNEETIRKYEVEQNE